MAGEATISTSATSPLTSQSITVTRSSGTVHWNIIALPSGTRSAAPFDTHSGVPCVATGSSRTPSCSLSTSNTNDMIIGMGTQGGSSIVWTPGAGSTLILSAPHGTPRVNAEYQIVAILGSTRSSCFYHLHEFKWMDLDWRRDTGCLVDKIISTQIIYLDFLLFDDIPIGVFPYIAHRE